MNATATADYNRTSANWYYSKMIQFLADTRRAISRGEYSTARDCARNAATCYRWYSEASEREFGA